MEIVIKDKSYFSNFDNHRVEKDYDYMLFRQDFSSSERVYFNKDKINDVIEKIENGEILIHFNYSILYSKTKELMNEAPDLGCYITLFKF